MYCKQCGCRVALGSLYCNSCGAKLNTTESIPNDRPSLALSFVGFFFPLIGFIVYVLTHSDKPKQAKSAGKGALIGFLTRVVISVILIVLYVVFTASLFSNVTSSTEAKFPAINDFFKEETIDDILEQYVDVSFGEFKVTNEGYYRDTSLEVVVTNKAATQYTYYITIEAVDEDGTRLATDTIYADTLNAGQKIKLTAFEYVQEDQIDEFKNATFKVLEIRKYDF